MSYQADELKKDLVHARKQLNTVMWELQEIRNLIDYYYEYMDDIKDLRRASNKIQAIIDELEIPKE